MNYRSDAIIAQLSADNNIAVLTFMIQELESAGVSVERQQEIMALFQTMRSDGTLHTQVAVAEAEVDLWDFAPAVQAFGTQMSNLAEDCREREEERNNESESEAGSER